MNFILLFVHSIWVTVAMAFLMPTFVRSAGAVTPPEPQKSPNLTGTGSVQIPDNLNPNPNPLQFPTKSEEVTFRQLCQLVWHKLWN